jgi:hypothetical protein
MAAPPRFVVRTYAPYRRFLLIGGAGLFGLFALYVAFESGRMNAGFDGRSARAKQGELQDRIRELDTQNHQQRLALAALETTRVGQIRERAEVAKTIGDLQAQVARQAQDLMFYRGVVGDNLQAEVVKIQQLRVVRGANPNEFLLKLVLGRPLRPEDAVNGSIKITFEGATAATPVNLDLGAVSSVPEGELRFNYRYVETIDQAIKFPEGFTPARTTIELKPSRKGANPVRQTFLWTVENA